MTVATAPGEEFWRNVLLGPEASPLPPARLDAQPGAVRLEVDVPDQLSTAVQVVADQLAVGRTTVWLTAHLAVVAALTGDTEVVTGCAFPGGAALPLRVSADRPSWRDLVAEVHRVESDLLAHRDYPVEELRRALSVSPRLFLTEADPTGENTAAPLPDTAWRVTVTTDDGRCVLRIQHDTAVVDASAAERVAGYHVAALAALTHDLDAVPAHTDLVGDAERRMQLADLAGPYRHLPDARFHQLFEHQVRQHPDTVAAVHRDERWTYRELNDRANHLGRALLARGLRREDVVAVVTERNLDWMASVIAIFKAGGTYLPIEPHFPADRITKMLTRADCRLVLTEAGSSTTLDEALPTLPTLPGVTKILIERAYAEPRARGDLEVNVDADELAYIYFTSGSTGEPKGAMCEHAGLLNHLYAKIDDLEIGAGDVVAQTAPQCFDISLWQLVSALLVGGRTVIVEQEVILDVDRFVETLRTSRVNVAQLVPSYLEAMLSALESSADGRGAPWAAPDSAAPDSGGLPDLRCVSATGEALKKELVQRWFATLPGVKLVNAFGLTETSDDTNHEVMDAVPARDRVPLGPAVNNVHQYVVDERLALVPFGSPGLIAFSGVCVGRGYINDPERTAQCYLDDPYRPGQRLYLGGDYGRWLPEGKLEFLGRRDNQVKISGFRIEIGDIENSLLQVPGVRDGAVVVAERPDRGPFLVGYYAADRPLDVEDTRTRLRQGLPDYMVPQVFRRHESLPLTANGKIDRLALRALAAGDEDTEPAVEPPATPTERRIAAAWASILGVRADQIGRQDNFFDRGGTSLSAVKVAIALDRVVKLKDLTRHPVLADLARLVDGVTPAPAGLMHLLSETARPPGPETGPGEVLICFPYAGGNAVNYRPLAAALRGTGLAVYAVELPGHEPATTAQPLPTIREVVDEVVREIRLLGLTRVMLYGHSLGTALAVETALALTGAGVEVEHLFLGACLLDDGADADRAAAGSALDPERAEPMDAQMRAAFQHDIAGARDYFANRPDGAEPVRVTAPVTVIVAADDPSTPRARDRYHGWERLADHVELAELSTGGHYFAQTEPVEVARTVLRSAEPIASPAGATASARRQPTSAN